MAARALVFWRFVELSHLRPVNYRKAMKTPPPEASATIVFTEDDLLQFELKVAQRADALSQETGRTRGKDLEHWLQAEREILEGCTGRAAGV
jgi:hypothetical protein